MKTALTSGDTTQAKTRLLEYYQRRTSVQYFELKGGGDISQANDNLNHYFTVVGIRKYAGSPDGTVDWSTYDAIDKEWHYQFHRMYWLTNLGRVYGSTGDEKYAIEWIAELIDWIHDNPPGYPRTLDTGTRLRNWVESYQYFINKYQSPSITPEDHITVLKSLMEQCRFLRDNWRSKGNWGASETRGLGAVVIMFPEFKFTPGDNWEWWRELVISRLHHHLSNDFYPDGVQFETSPSYHSLEYRNLFITYQLMALNSISISEELLKRFIKPLEFMMHIHKPDGYLPQLSDTDRKSYLDRLKEGAELFGRQDMLYAATRGAQGTPPQETFAPFPYGGYFVMRSDWGQNQSKYENTKYLVFDTGSNEPWHAHYDILNFEAYANKYVLVRDPGRYTYVRGSWRDYFKNTTAHNTIVVDNQNQKQNIAGSPIYWASLPGFDYVSGQHKAYTGLTHERRVFFVKPEYWIISDLVTGSGSHTYDLYFHLDAPYLNHANLDASNHSVATPNFIILPSDVSASAEVINGWVSNSYNSKQQAPIVKYQKNGAPPITFETILLPYDSGEVPLAVEKPGVLFGQNAVEPAEAVCLIVQLGNMTDWFFHSTLSPGILSFESFQCDAKAAFIRIESDNSIPNIQLVQGSLLYKGDTLLVDTDAEFANVSWFQQSVFIESEFIQYAKIWAPHADSVVVNGSKVNFIQNGNYIEFTITSVHHADELSVGVAKGFQLEQNYPNPFNNITSIRFILPTQKQVTLRIYNLLGQAVATLIDRKMDAGEHTIIWNGTDDHKQSLSSSIYFYRLQVGEKIMVRRLL
ncbi:MAG: heparinase II/III family protein, partial [bacterium]